MTPEIYTIDCSNTVDCNLSYDYNCAVDVEILFINTEDSLLKSLCLLDLGKVTLTNPPDTIEELFILGEITNADALIKQLDKVLPNLKKLKLEDSEINEPLVIPNSVVSLRCGGINLQKGITFSDKLTCLSMDSLGLDELPPLPLSLKELYLDGDFDEVVIYNDLDKVVVDGDIKTLVLKGKVISITSRADELIIYQPKSVIALDVTISVGNTWLECTNAVTVTLTQDIRYINAKPVDLRAFTKLIGFNYFGEVSFLLPDIVEYANGSSIKSRGDAKVIPKQLLDIEHSPGGIELVIDCSRQANYIANLPDDYSKVYLKFSNMHRSILKHVNISGNGPIIIPDNLNLSITYQGSAFN